MDVKGELDGTGVARPVGGREHVPCLPGHGDGATGVRWHGRDTRRARGLWAALNGVLPWCVSCRPPREVPTLQKSPARAGQRATDARKAPRTRVKLRTRGRGYEHRAKRIVSL